MIWKLILPLTVISLALFTKWWYVLVFDGPDDILKGFPLPFVCNGWHTSLSFQIFIFEFIIDFIIFFTVWFLIVFLINRFVAKIKVHKIQTAVLIVISGLIGVWNILLASNPDNISKLKRDFEIKILETGFVFSWNHIERPDLNKYALTQKDYIQNISINWNDSSIIKTVDVMYISETSDKFLGNSYCKKIEDVNFIDSIYKLNKHDKERLISLIKDCNNIKFGNCEPDRFFVYSGFIFTRNDTLIGSISMTYDFKYFEFSPVFDNSTSWKLTENGLSQMTDFINDIKKKK